MNAVKDSDVLIEVKDLCKSFVKDKLVLNHLNCQIHKGDRVVMIGPSGGGKSTFLRCMNLLEQPTSGHIFYQGQDLTDKNADLDKLRAHMGMVFQHFNLFPHFTVLKNMTFAPVKLGLKTQEEAEAQAMALLERVGRDRQVCCGKQSAGRG